MSDIHWYYVKCNNFQQQFPDIQKPTKIRPKIRWNTQLRQRDWFYVKMIRSDWRGIRQKCICIIGDGIICIHCLQCIKLTKNPLSLKEILRDEYPSYGLKLIIVKAGFIKQTNRNSWKNIKIFYSLSNMVTLFCWDAAHVGISALNKQTCFRGEKLAFLWWG